MKSDKKFLIVKKYIDKMDYYSLLSQGAPYNEFDSESKKISKLIASNQSEFQIAEIISKIFNDSFSSSDSPDAFINIAKKIKQELESLNIFDSPR